MKDDLISKYIDNELSLDEKVEFVKIIKEKDEFYSETLELLKQEKMLSFEVKYTKPLEVKTKSSAQCKTNKLRFLYPIIAAAAVILLFLSLTIGGLKNYISENRQQIHQETAYRFVYYNSSARNVELVGSFTGWKKIYMHRVDNTGYWQIYVKLPKNDLYKYNFVVNEKQIINDPSNPMRIHNGFGGIDSVLRL